MIQSTTPGIGFGKGLGSKYVSLADSVVPVTTTQLSQIPLQWKGNQGPYESK